MKRTHWILAVIVTVLALSFSAIAQPPGGGRGQGQGPGGPGPGGPGPGGQGPVGPGPGGPGGLSNLAAMFRNPQMREAFAKELELTSQQTTEMEGAVRATEEKVRTQIQEFMQARMRGGEPGTPPPNREEMQRLMAPLIDKELDGAQASVDRILKPEQRTKLREVTFQLSGGLESPMLSSPMGGRMLETLELTDAQKEQLGKLMEGRTRPDPADYDLRSPEGRQKFQEDMAASNAKFAEQVKGILTPEQKAKAEKLTTGIPALRGRFGIPEPGQQGRQPGRQQEGQAPPAFAPGDGSWRPGGQPTPGRQQQPNRFPRGGN